MQERRRAHEIARAVDGVSVAQRFDLGDEGEAAGVVANRFGVGAFISRRDHDSDLRHASAERLFDEDCQDGFLRAVAVNERL